MAIVRRTSKAAQDLISIGEFIPAHDLRAADRPIPEGIEVIRVLHGARALRGQLE